MTEYYSRQSERDGVTQTSQTRKQLKQKLFVDASNRNGADNKERDKSKKQLIFDNITEALDAVKEPSVIKITSFNYKE